MTGIAIFLFGMAAGMTLLAVPMLLDKSTCPVCLRAGRRCTRSHR